MNKPNREPILANEPHDSQEVGIQISVWYPGTSEEKTHERVILTRQEVSNEMYGPGERIKRLLRKAMKVSTEV